MSAGYAWLKRKTVFWENLSIRRSTDIRDAQDQSTDVIRERVACREPKSSLDQPLSPLPLLFGARQRHIWRVRKIKKRKYASILLVSEENISGLTDCILIEWGFPERCLLSRFKPFLCHSERLPNLA